MAARVAPRPRVALALAAVLPAAVHLDGMITNETLLMLLSAAVFVVAPSAIAARAHRPDRARCWGWACCSGWR